VREEEPDRCVPSVKKNRKGVCRAWRRTIKEQTWCNKKKDLLLLKTPAWRRSICSRKEKYGKLPFI